MEYGGHVDNAIMGSAEPMRADVSITVFLNDASEYDGGELVINNDGEASRVKLGIGGAVVYSASTIHRVMPVTRGSRHAAVIWAQSFVRDEARREMLLELSQAAKWARSVSSGAHEAMKLSKVRANLMRMWAEL